MHISLLSSLDICRKDVYIFLYPLPVWNDNVTFCSVHLKFLCFRFQITSLGHFHRDGWREILDWRAIELYCKSLHMLLKKIKQLNSITEKPFLHQEKSPFSLLPLFKNLKKTFWDNNKCQECFYTNCFVKGMITFPLLLHTPYFSPQLNFVITLKLNSQKCTSWIDLLTECDAKFCFCECICEFCDFKAILRFSYLL